MHREQNLGLGKYNAESVPNDDLSPSTSGHSHFRAHLATEYRPSSKPRLLSFVYQLNLQSEINACGVKKNFSVMVIRIALVGCTPLSCYKQSCRS